MALTKEKSAEFLSELEGYHQQLKMLHWGADRHAEHILTDDIDGAVLDFEDRIAENVMGFLGEKFSDGDLKALMPNAKDLKGVLNEMEGDVISFGDEIHGEKGGSGIVNILDEFLENINKWKYLETLS